MMKLVLVISLLLLIQAISARHLTPQEEEALDKYLQNELVNNDNPEEQKRWAGSLFRFGAKYGRKYGPKLWKWGKEAVKAGLASEAFNNGKQYVNKAYNWGRRKFRSWFGRRRDAMTEAEYLQLFN